MGYGLQFKKSSFLQLQALSDTDWARDIADRRSTSGMDIFMGPNIISWCSRKQKSVSCSSSEADYRVLADATSEIIWVQSLLTELQFSSPRPPVLWCDNMGATYLTTNPIFHQRMKNIEMPFIMFVNW